MSSSTSKPSNRTERFTKKEIKFLKGLAEGKTKTKAALDAYDTDSPAVASVIAAENLNKPRIKQAYQEAMQAAGFTPEAVGEVLKDALHANKTYQVKDKLLLSEHPDHGTRLGAVKTGAIIMGLQSKDNDGGGGITFNIGTRNYVNVEGEK